MKLDLGDGGSISVQLLSNLSLDANREDSFGRQPGIVKAVFEYDREEHPLVTFEVVEHGFVRRRLFPRPGESCVRKLFIGISVSLEIWKIRQLSYED